MENFVLVAITLFVLFMFYSLFKYAKFINHYPKELEQNKEKAKAAETIEKNTTENQ